MKKLLLYIIFLVGAYSNVSAIINPTNALFWLDGTIEYRGGSYYLNDTSGNGRDFLITNYDFPTGTKGFQFKSGATISAPAGDATLIAEDVNNFLYDAGGTPNQIYVISLFQNVDYVNKLFCRRVQRTTNANGRILTDSRVLDIVLYDTALSGDSLTAANSYYGVPTKLGSGIREVGAGKTYATIAAAITAAVNGETVYIYSGDYNLSGTGLSCSKSLTFIGLGNVRLRSSSAVSNMFIASNTITFEGVNLDATNTINTFWNPSGTLTLKRNRFYNCDALMDGTASQGKTKMYDCLIMTGRTTYMMFPYKGTEFNGCYISTTRTLFRNAADVDTVTFKYNRGTAVTFLATNSKKINVIISLNNIWSSTGAQAYVVYSNDTTSMRFDSISCLKPITPTTVSSGGFYMDSCKIYGNSNSGVLLTTGVDTYISNSHIYNSNADSYAVRVFPSASATSTIYFYNNRVKSNGGNDIGDATFVIKNKISGTVKNNIFIQTGSALNNSHGCCIWENNNIEFAYNRVEGWAYSIVCKGAGTEMNNVRIHHNVFKDGHSVCKGVSNVRLYNNTFYRTRGYPSMDVLTTETGQYSLGTIMINNICIVTTGGTVSGFLCESANNTFTLNNNLYYTPNGKSGAIITSYYTLSEMQGLGYDNGSIFIGLTDVNNMFTNLDGSNFSLQAESKAMNIGLNLGSLFEYSLSGSTTWGSDSELPVITLMKQGYKWDVGAYTRSDIRILQSDADLLKINNNILMINY